MRPIRSWRQLHHRRKNRIVSWLKNIFLSRRKTIDKPADRHRQNEEHAFKFDNSEDMAKKTTNKRKPTAPITRPVRKQPTSYKGGGGGWMWFVSGILLLLSAALIFGAWRFATSKNQTSEDLLLEIEGPQQVAIGEEVEFVVNYQNVSNLTLRNLELTLKYPLGLKIISVEPAASNALQTIWQLGDLAPGAQGKVVIRGQIFVDEPQSDNLSASLLYQPQNFSSDFIKQASHSLQIGEPLFELDLVSPQVILPDTKTDFSIKWKRQGEVEGNNIYLQLLTGKDFTLSIQGGNLPSIIEKDQNKIYEWKIDSGKVQSDFDFSGKFSAESKGEKIFKLRVIKRNGVDDKVLQEKEFNLFISAEEILLDFSLNDDNPDQLPPGADLTYVVFIKNTSGQTLRNLAVSVQLSPAVIDWSFLQTPSEPKITDKGEIIILPDKLPALQELTQGEEIELTIKTKLKSNISLPAKLKSSAMVEIGSVGEEEQDNLTFSSPVIITTIASPVNFDAQAFYFDDEGVKIGSGAWPPQVGQSTEMVVKWFMRPRDKSLNNIKVEAVLPVGIVWLGPDKVDQGSLFYNNSTRKVVWQINSLTPTSHDIVASFRIAFTPTNDQVGRVVKILSESIFTAQADSGNIYLTAPALDTNLTGNLFGSGQGQVVD